jgi:hypothetical protein
MMNPKESGVRIEVEPHDMIDVAMEDLPEGERRALEKELEEEEACVFPKNMHGGDQEIRPGHDDYDNCYTYGNI